MKFRLLKRFSISSLVLSFLFCFLFTVSFSSCRNTEEAKGDEVQTEAPAEGSVEGTETSSDEDKEKKKSDDEHPTSDSDEHPN